MPIFNNKTQLFPGTEYGRYGKSWLTPFPEKEITSSNSKWQLIEVEKALAK